MSPPIAPSPAVLALTTHTPSGPASTSRPSLTALLASGQASSPGKVRASRTYLPKHGFPKRIWWKLVSDGGSAVEHRRAARTDEAKRKERDDVARCGSWVKHGIRPTDLFLDIYGSVLQTLNHDPRIGVCSPSLLGTTGTVPMTVISLIPDIIEHHATLIRGAEHEVLLFTNYWQISNSQRTISDALIALSDRLGREHAERLAEAQQAGQPSPPKRQVIVKLVYDRGTLRHLIHPHSPVPPEMWPAIDLPKESEIPNLSMQVLNYHRLLLGTFHAKFLVVDRKAALLCSNNIQDRPNLEMMVHLEGDVVQSLYDTALVSFSARLEPPLPLLKQPPPEIGPDDFTFQEKNDWLKAIPLVGAAEATRKLLRLLRDRTEYDSEEAQKNAAMPERGRMRNLMRTMIEQGMEAPPREQPVRTQSGWFEGMVDVVTSAADRSRPASRSMSRRNSRERKRGGTWADFAGTSKRIASPPVQHANLPVDDEPASALSSQAPTPSQADGPLTPLPTSGGADLADVDAAAEFHRRLESSLADIKLSENGHAVAPALPPVPSPLAQPVPLPSSEQPSSSTATTMAAAPPSRHVQLLVDEPGDLPLADIESPVLTREEARRRTEALLKAAGVPLDTGAKTAMDVNVRDGDKALLSRLERMSEKLNAGVLSEPLPTVEDSDAIDDFTPHIFHAPHRPVPMALVNRGPRGTPGHQDLRTPQNAAWLAGFRCSKRKVFIQTPTFNARPVVDAAIDACKRGVEVVLYVGLGFNDKGESIPFQGGTNEEVTVRMYAALRACRKEQFLKVFWYVGKDQSRPLNAAIKQRNCHVKLAIFDDAVGMCGNGNQDTQSWYHSQETNVLIDSQVICADWIQVLAHNQNTHLYGLVDSKDGRWRNDRGQTVEDLDQLALAAKEKKAREDGTAVAA